MLSKRKVSLRTNDLDFDVNLDETFAEWVDIYETRVDSTIKSTELGDQTDVTLRHTLIRIRADDTARNRPYSTNAVSEAVDYYAISWIPRWRWAQSAVLTYSCFRTNHDCPRSRQQVSARSLAGDPPSSGAQR